MEAHSVGYPGSFVDIPTSPEQTGHIIFTMAWPEQDGQERWLGKNIDVSVVVPPASTKP
jgi:glucoamylase